MAMLAMAVPILPGMNQKWDEEIMGRIQADKTAVDEIRDAAVFTKEHSYSVPLMGIS